jgi:hypothetical protein
VIDAARMVTELEIQEGRGVQYLDEMVRNPSVLATAPISIMSESETSSALDAHGASGLLIGPSLIDVACAQAREHGAGFLICRNAKCLPFLPMLFEQGRRRCIATLIAIAPAGTGMPDTGRMGAVTLSARFFPVDEAALPVRKTASALDPSSDLALRDLIEAAVLACWRPGAAMARFRDSFMRASEAQCRRISGRWPPLDESGDVLIACVDDAKAGRPPSPRPPFEWPRNGGYDWIEMGVAAMPPDEAEVKAMTEGIAVDATLWRRLSDWANRSTLVAASERSRIEAGPYSGTGRQPESIA